MINQKQYMICFLVLILCLGCSERKSVMKRRIMSLEKKAAVALAQNDYSGAEKAYTDIIKLDPQNEIVKNYLAILYLKYLKKPEKAKSLWEELVQEYPHNSAYLNNLGGIYQERGDYEKAIKLYEQAKKYHKNYQMPFYNMGKIYILKENYDKAVDELKKGLKISPKDSNMIATLSLALMLNNQTIEAHQRLLKALKATPRSSVIIQMICRVDRVLGDLEEAEHILDYYFKDGGNNPILLIEKAEIVFSRKHTNQEIEKLLDRFSQISLPDYIKWYESYLKARIDIEKGDFETGIKALESICSSLKDRYSYYKGLVLRALMEGYRLQNENEKAENIKQTIAKTAPEFLMVKM